MAEVQQQVQTIGQATGMRVRVIEDPNDLTKGAWLTTAHYFDDRLRTVQTIGDNYRGGRDTLTNRYNFTGQVISSYLAHNNPKATSNATTHLKTNINYDHANRLLEVYKTINDADSTKRLLARSPLVFVDPNGMDNVVYLYAADNSVTNKQLKAIAAAATANFKTLGLKTQVKIFKGTFDSKAYGKLDKTDAVTVIGNQKNVIKAISTFNPGQGKTLANSGFGDNRTDNGTNPEEGQNPRSNPQGGSNDNVIAIGTEATKSFAEDTKSTFENAAGFLIDHSAGHLSNLNHAGQDNGYDDQGNYQINGVSVPNGPNIMSKGNIIVNNINKTPLQDYITSPANRQPANNEQHTLSIQQAYLHRFGNNTPVAKLPTQ